MAVEYQLVHVNRLGHELTHAYSSETELAEGDLLRVEGRDWLVDGHRGRARTARARALPARAAPSGRAHGGRRLPPLPARRAADRPQLQHGRRRRARSAGRSPTSASQRDEQGKPYLELTAERDYSEAEDAPDLPEHELEHALARDDGRGRRRARRGPRQSGQLVELVALEPGEAPDWAEAERYIDALVIEEIEDDLLVLCGVDPDNDPRDGWLDTVKARLREDLRRFRDGHRERPRPDRGVGLPRRPRLRLDRQLRRPGEPGSRPRLAEPAGRRRRQLYAAGFSRVRQAQLLVD